MYFLKWGGFLWRLMRLFVVLVISLGLATASWLVRPAPAVAVSPGVEAAVDYFRRSAVGL
jgi:uncharacterized membrane protein YjgN (DUF898 family)